MEKAGEKRKGERERERERKRTTCSCIRKTTSLSRKVFRSELFVVTLSAASILFARIRTRRSRPCEVGDESRSEKGRGEGKRERERKRERGGEGSRKSRPG
jgi:hypothetical protein